MRESGAGRAGGRTKTVTTHATESQLPWQYRMRQKEALSPLTNIERQATIGMRQHTAAHLSPPFRAILVLFFVAEVHVCLQGVVLLKQLLVLDSVFGRELAVALHYAMACLVDLGLVRPWSVVRRPAKHSVYIQGFVSREQSRTSPPSAIAPHATRPGKAPHAIRQGKE